MSSFLGDLPRLSPRPEQTIAGVGKLLRQGELSCVDILEACFQQVESWEPKVQAWVVLDREGAIEQARVLEEELRSGKDRGPLHGIPIGIKDIIDVKGLPTACGSKRWVNRVAEKDAEVVAQLREAGAVIMGKTVTTPYAWIDPPPTRNPWDLDRTPGGSSSGSAAAVACGMCYAAIGSQTGGSITRPASFCGVAGMKASRGFVSSLGVLPFASSLDHVGPLTRSVGDLQLVFGAIHRPFENLSKEKADESPLTRPPRLARFRGFFDHTADPVIRTAFEGVSSSLATSGVEIVDIDDPVDFEQVIQDHRRIMAAEAASVHSDWLDEFPEDYPPRIEELIREGRSIRALDYVRARDGQFVAMKKIMSPMFRYKVQAAITPATVGLAPDPSTTGNPAFNSPWSYCGLPTVSFPTGLTSERLPAAIQLVRYIVLDYDLLRTARWCEDAIRTSRQ